MTPLTGLFGTGAAAVQAGSAAMQSAATDIATATRPSDPATIVSLSPEAQAALAGEPPSLEQGMVDMKLGTYAFEAGLGILRTADATLEELLRLG